MEEKIELQKTRDFGEIISDSFLFVRENFKPLLKSYFTFCGFFLVAGAIANIMQQIKIKEISDSMEFGNEGTAAFRQFGLEYFLVLGFAALSFTALQVTTLSYMAIYRQKNKETPTSEEVWGFFKHYFLRILGSLVVNLILLIIGSVFCLIPGIYLYPILGLTFPIMIMENAGYGHAFGQSFKLIKSNWWMVFGSLFVIGLIVAILVSLAVAPFTVSSILESITRPTKSIPHMSMPSAIIASVLGQVLQATYMLPVITLGLCYYSLNESKEGSGLLNRVNTQLGNNTPDPNAPAEEY